MSHGFEIFAEKVVTPENVNEVIEEQINQNELMVYMKGSPSMPQCGFSARVVQILNLLGVKYTTFNILSNMTIREGLKSYSNWPSFPQVYYKNELLGGCDIISDMHQSGELEQKLGA